ncbi:MAG: 2-C-methyl-D-erythritol 4-phosphate cytidylyltransferase [Chthoniobacterales bacterium]|jgi:2-C-methyl-D-erythritol 4-phosphate cytidylyltransferase
MTSAIVVAAGTSQRMGFDKLTAILAGCPVFIRTLQRFEICSDVKEIILVVHPDRLKPFGALVADFGLSKVNRVVAGGEQRHLSVAAGLQATSPTGDLVAVHDGARPLISPHLISLAIREARACGAVAVAAPIVETLKRADEEQQVVGSVERVGLWTMQTPQVFRREWLIRAYDAVLAGGVPVTDEVSAIQTAGFPVKLLTNPGWNLKITYPRDLDLARILFNLESSNV